MVNKNIFITGATGFIGRRLALKLAETNQVLVLVRPESIKKTEDLREKGIKVLLGDLLEPASYSKELKDMDYVFHLAALFKLEAPKEELYRHNVLGTKRLLESCIGANIEKIIYFSTAYVAGMKEKDFITEDEPYPAHFKNWYEWSKAKGEKVILDFYQRYNLPVVIVRPAIVYGPGSFYGFYNALFLISKGKLRVFPGNGGNKIHLVHVDDVVNAAIHILEIKNNSGEIYHICDNFPQPCSELVKLACHQLGIRPPLLTLPRFMIKLGSRLPVWKLLFREMSTELLDYFLYNQTYANTKLRATGFSFDCPSPLNGLEAAINWYKENSFCNKES